MNRLGIIGYPLGHSLSPVMHTNALNFLGLDGSYEKLETLPENLAEAVNFVKKQDFCGFNVTIPYKTDIIKYLDEIDTTAKAAGAVNTVKINSDKTMIGYNTDIYGFVNAIEQNTQAYLAGKNVAILGCGGAARAVIFALDSLNVNKITIYARNIEKAKEFVSTLKINSSIEVCELNADSSFWDISMIVNTTPLGMEGKFENVSPVSKESLLTMPADGIVYDIVYKPRNTKLLQLAKECGFTTIEGIEMLILQGAKAFEIWTGQIAPVKIMRKAALENL